MRPEPRRDMAGDERCGCVVWRDRERRCELWRVQGTDRLRLFDGEVLVTDEPVPAWRAVGAGARAPDVDGLGGGELRAFGVVPGDERWVLLIRRSWPLRQILPPTARPDRSGRRAVTTAGRAGPCGV